MDSSEIRTIEEKCSSRATPKRPVVIVKGQGALVWDADGKEYIDCIGGHGVCNVGHCHPKVVEAIRRQSEKLLMCTQGVYNDVRAELLEKLIGITPKELAKAFLSNTGTESVECAIKAARKYTGKPGIIAMKRAFHGRTLGSLSATWRPEYRKSFEPLVPGFKHVKFGDADAVDTAIDGDTAAVIVEPVQGEGGVYVAPDGYLQRLREICDERGVLLIFDEVQTGFGRTGKMFALEHWGVAPDILCLAKGIAGGVPMGVTVGREEIMDSFQPMEHGSTFGGNPLACAAAAASIDAIVEEKMSERAARRGLNLMERLRELQDRQRMIREIRGLGLMIGVELRFRCKDVIDEATNRGLLVLSAGLNIVRFLPPLVIAEEQLERAFDLFDQSMQAVKR